ncbi:MULTISPECIES: hypothetical protein [Hyphobacterium]|uniref:Uncharacterized protein n=1 Tax=Hyphobacterium vulgare TaxID=1736751 RepID=A0ABV6ZSV7_9PROT
MRTLLTYVLAALAAATMTVGMLTGLSPEAWQIERLPDLALLWFGLWAVAGSLIWFVIASGARHFLNWGNRTWWTIIRSSAVFAGFSLLLTVPLFGPEYAAHVQTMRSADHQNEIQFGLFALIPGLMLLPLAAIPGAIWGAVFWLREPRRAEALPA